jgi:hypothetical protein
MLQGLWQIYRIAMRGLALSGFVFGAVFSPEMWMAGKVVALAGQGAIAEYRLRSVPAERYAEEIETALAARDIDLARSLVALAAQQKAEIPETLLAAVAAEPAFDLGAAAQEAGTCIFQGDFNSEAGFACVIATDLTGIGDVRDLVTEGGALVLGQPYDPLTLGLATVGLTLTGATLVSMGAAAPLRAGTSFLKATNKTRKLPPKLADELGRTIGNAVDGDAVGAAVNLAATGRFAEMSAPLGRILKPRSIERLTGLADDFGAIYRAGGVPAMKQSLALADSTADARRLAATSAKYGRGYRGTLTLLGAGVIRLTDLVLEIGGWLLFAALWIFGVLWFVTRTAAKLLYRALRPRPARTRGGRVLAAS